MSHDHKRENAKFSLSLFVINITTSLLGIFYVVYLISPSVWKVQIEANIVSIVIIGLITHLLGAFVEFFFHRYVLHAPVIPFLSYFYRQHTHHHSLTRVTMKRVSGIVENYYPILEEKQYEASFFPWYSLLVFSGIATPTFVLIQWVYPTLPILLGGYSGIALSMLLYETLHALEHVDVVRWRPLLEHRRFGSFWKLLYGFHLRHHASICSNESISGFFGFPLPDILFGTYMNPESLYSHGERGNPKDFIAPKPLFFIRWLDNLAEVSVKHSREKKC